MPDAPTVAEMYEEAMRLSALIDEGIAALGRVAREYAEAEAAYRRAKSEAWVECPSDEAGAKPAVWTAARREAWVNSETATMRERRDIAEGMKQAGLEAVRSRRAQLSAVQTFANAHREEAALARTGVAA